MKQIKSFSFFISYADPANVGVKEADLLSAVLNDQSPHLPYELDSYSTQKVVFLVFSSIELSSLPTDQVLDPWSVIGKQILDKKGWAPRVIQRLRFTIPALPDSVLNSLKEHPRPL